MSSPLDFATPARPDGALATWSLRRGRVSWSQRDALERLWAARGVPVDGRPLDPVALFGRTAPVLLEVGFGMGEATLQTAVEQPGTDVLAVDVHTPGLGALLRGAEEAGATNVRVAEGDARVLLAMLPPRSLSGVRVLFPDPWPKARHAKRRLLTPGFVAQVAGRLAPGGVLHVATDWPGYAEQVARVLDGSPLRRCLPPARPVTRFERQGLAAGRAPVDLAARLDGPSAHGLSADGSSADGLRAGRGRG